MNRRKGTPATGRGRALTELRRSSAAGSHGRRTRRTERRKNRQAIRSGNHEG